MKQVYRIEVDCANCASKMENAAGKVPGAAEVTVNFMTQKMTVEYGEGCDPASVLREIVKVCRKVDSDFEIEL